MTMNERIGYLLRDQASRTPGRELFVFEGRRVTYGEFNAWVTTVATTRRSLVIQRPPVSHPWLTVAPLAVPEAPPSLCTENPESSATAGFGDHRARWQC
jgi:non-ribosomal peptide synthetase component F